MINAGGRFHFVCLAPKSSGSMERDTFDSQTREKERKRESSNRSRTTTARSRILREGKNTALFAALSPGVEERKPESRKDRPAKGRNPSNRRARRRKREKESYVSLLSLTARRCGLAGRAWNPRLGRCINLFFHQINTAGHLFTRGGRTSFSFPSSLSLRPSSFSSSVAFSSSSSSVAAAIRSPTSTYLSRTQSR